MELKVGDRVRIKTLGEMLKNCHICFYGHGFFRKWGNHKFIITDIDDSINNIDGEFLGKVFKINVNDEWGGYYISPNSFEKAIKFDMKLDGNLFEL